MHTRDPRLRRCGWASLAICDDGLIVGGVFQGIEVGRHTVPRAELIAVVYTLQHNKAIHVTIHVDPSWIVKGYIQGPKTEAKSVNGDLWADFWQLYWARGGPSGVTILKVDAHHNVEDVLMGKIGALEFLGNAFADQAAKIAAKQIQVSEDFVSQVNFADARAWLVQKRMLVAYKDKLELDKTSNERTARNKPKKGRRLPQKRQELLDIIHQNIWAQYALGWEMVPV